MYLKCTYLVFIHSFSIIHCWLLNQKTMTEVFKYVLNDFFLFIRPISSALINIQESYHPLPLFGSVRFSGTPE